MGSTSPDATKLVEWYVAENERFIAEYGEADFGHIYATWGESLDALAPPGAPTPDDDDVGGWSNVFYAVRMLSERMFTCRDPRDMVRLIVWANW